VVEEVGRATGRPARHLTSPGRGRSAAGNAGLAGARGRFCLFLDDDDLLFSDHLETLTSALLQKRGPVAAYTLSWDVTTDDAQLLRGAYTELSHGIPTVLRQPFDAGVLEHHNFLPIQSVLFARRLFLERGGFDETMDALEDWSLWQRYAFGHDFLYVPRVTSMFRTPADPSKVARRQKTLDRAYPLVVEATRRAIAGLRKKPKREGR
jgi:glycosyltransferase involved in cell wall biosynthesis